MLGDDFDLRGALELFKNAQSPEDFEKKLNADDSKINNLDLNNDGKVDYIKVIDNRDGDAHALVLQVAVNETETQDVAAIEIEKDGDQSAKLQITGDKELYGKETYLQPVDEKELARESVMVKNRIPIESIIYSGSSSQTSGPRAIAPGSSPLNT